MTLPIPTSFAAGTHEVAQLIFVVSSEATDQTTLTFGDQPVTREVSDCWRMPFPLPMSTAHFPSCRI